MTDRKINGAVDFSPEIDDDPEVEIEFTQATGLEDLEDYISYLQGSLDDGTVLSELDDVPRDRRIALGHLMRRVGDVLVTGKLPPESTSRDVRFCHFPAAGATLAVRPDESTGTAVVGAAWVNSDAGDQFSRFRGRQIAGGRTKISRYRRCAWQTTADIEDVRTVLRKARLAEVNGDVATARTLLRGLFGVVS